jgi:hypothetical protein
MEMLLALTSKDQIAEEAEKTEFITPDWRLPT